MKQGWEIKKLGEVATILNGYAFDSKLFSEDSNGMPLIRIRDIKRGYTETFYKGDFSEEYIIRKGDYLIGMDGEFNIAEWKGDEALLNQRVCKIIANDIVDRYLFWYMPVVLKQIEGATPFVTVKHLSSKQLLNTIIPVPSREEQERIVAELDCLSGVIERKREQLKQLDALAQSIFYQMFGDPITNEKGWDVKKMGEIVQSNMIGLTRSGAEQGESKQYLYFKMNNISNKGGVDFSKLTRVDASNSEIEKYSLSYGDFLFNTRNSFDLVGKSCVYNVRYGEIMVFNNNIMRIVFNQNVSTIYMAYLFQNRYISEQLDKIKKGTTSVWAIYYKDLEHILVNIPPFALQQEFADKIEAIEKQKELIRQSIAQTEELFNSRMDYYFK